MTHVAKYCLHCGDTLTIEWDGNVWVSPTCGAQWANKSEAMKVELADYLRACGEGPGEGEDVDLDAYGEWIDE